MAFMGLPCPRNKTGSFMVLSLLFETGCVLNVMLGSINMSYEEIKGDFIDRWFLNGKMILWQQLGEFSV